MTSRSSTPARSQPTRPARTRPQLSGDDGAQALELAMALPVILALALLLLGVGQLGVAAVRGQQIAGLAARMAATQPDHVVRDALATHLGDAQLQLVPPSSARRPGDLVTAVVRGQVGPVPLTGRTIGLTATATALTERADP